MVRINKHKRKCYLTVVLLYIHIDQSSLFSIPSSYEFEMTSTQRCLYVYLHILYIYMLFRVICSKLMSQPVSMGNLSPIMDLPELDDIDMDVG